MHGFSKVVPLFSAVQFDVKGCVKIVFTKVKCYEGKIAYEILVFFKIELNKYNINTYIHSTTESNQIPNINPIPKLNGFSKIQY